MYFTDHHSHSSNSRIEKILTPSLKAFYDKIPLINMNPTMKSYF